MKTYLEPAKEIPVSAETDVLVVGGGPAGIGAALAAARAGAKTMLIESSNVLGGMSTSGMMSHWSGADESPLPNEVLDRMRQCKSMPEQVQTENKWAIAHECLKSSLCRMMKETGVTVQFYTLAAGVIMNGNKVTGVITESKSGREAIMAKVVVDASGDGDIAAKAGAEYLLGREEDHICQPVTLMFRIAGVDYTKAVFPPSFETNIDLPKGEIQALGRAHLPAPAGHVLLYQAPLPGEVCVNMTNVIHIDGTNVRDLSRAEEECRYQLDCIVAFLREYVPGYEHCYAVSSAQNVGVRETRHFKGLYTITAEDIVEARVFEDWIATRNAFNFDIHSLKGPGLDEHGAQKHFYSKGKYTIPYRACVPEKIDGLLLSGRNISGTHKAHSNFRVMSICLNIGQGTGVAAALAAKHGIQPREVDVKEIQKILTEAGVKP